MCSSDLWGHRARTASGGSVSLEGEPQHLNTKLALTVGREGALSATGALNLAAPRELLLDFQGRALDLQSLDGTLPPSRVGARGHLRVQFPETTDPTLDLSVETDPTLVDGVRIPGLAAQTRWTPRELGASVAVNEPGLPCRLDLSQREGGPLSLTLDAPWFSLQGVPRLRRWYQGTGRARARVQAKLRDGVVQGSLSAELAALQSPEAQLDQGTLQGSFGGKLSSPHSWTLHAQLEATDANVGDVRLSRALVKADGPVTSPRVSVTATDSRGAALRGAGTLDTRGGFSLRDVDFDVLRGEEHLQGRLASVAQRPSGLELSGLQLSQGSGQLAGQVSLGSKEIALDLEGNDLELGSIARTLGLPRGAIEGRANIKAHLKARGAERQGSLEVHLADGSLAHVGGLSLQLAATLDGDRVRGEAIGQLPSIGLASAQWDLAVPGELTQPQDWAKATGTLQLFFGQLDLRQLNAWLPKDQPVESLSGSAQVALNLLRKPETPLPDVSLTAGVSELTVKLRPGVVATEGGASREIRGITPQLAVTFAGATGTTSAELSLSDAEGALLRGDAQLVIAPEELTGGRQRALEALIVAPFQLALVVPSRDPSRLHLPFPLPLSARRFSAKVQGAGHIGAPTLAASAQLLGARLPGSDRALPFDLELQGQYLFERATLGLQGSLRGSGRELALFDVQAHHVRDASRELPWDGRVLMNFTGMPLTLLPAFAESEVQGELLGSLAANLDGTGLSGQADIPLHDVRVGGLTLGGGRIKADVTPSAATANLDFEGVGSRLAAGVNVPLEVRGGLPAFSGQAPIDVRVSATHTDAAVLAPLVSEYLSELNGPVDADLQARFEPPVTPEGRWNAHFDGSAAMTGGEVQLSQLGMALQDVTWTARAHTEGERTIVELDDGVARAHSDHHNVSLRTRLQFTGLELTSAQAGLRLEEVPLALQGVSQASATGEATLTLQRTASAVEVNVNLDTLHATLPRSSRRNVIDVDDHPAIEVLQPLTKPSRVTAKEGELPMVLTFELGKDVRVLRGDLDVPLSGRPVLTLGPEKQMSGWVELKPGGRVQLLGKAFEIENGVVQFDTGDPTDPSVQLTAVWVGPSHRVYVELRGTLSNANLTLSSDPALPEDEVFALLLGGSDAGATTTGVGVGATLLSNVFAGTPLSAVELRTSAEADRSNYTAAVQISDEVWFEATYQSPEQNSSAPGASSQDPGFSGTVDWRFRRQWSLRSELGTLGAGFDLLWQYRY